MSGASPREHGKRALFAVFAILASTARANAQQPDPHPPRPQQIACDECVRGEQALAAMGSAGVTLRQYAPVMTSTLVPLRIRGDVLDASQERRVRGFVTDAPINERSALHQLTSKSDDEVLAISYALCKSPDPDCAQSLMGALRHVRYIAESIVDPVQQPYGLPDGPGTCDPTVGHVRSPKIGVGVEYATGWQDSVRAVDGRVWSLGIEARARLRDSIGFIARVDRSTGRDEARDEDGDGRDDVETGRVLRWTMMGGLSLRFHTLRDREAPQYWQVDSLVGWSRAGDQSGLLVGYDISYQLVVARLGVRMLVGFGDASEERAALLHTGFMFGAGPQYYYGAGCSHVEQAAPSSRAAIALDIPLSGWAQHGGYITPGFGLEGALHLHSRFDALLRADLLVMPNGDGDRSLHQSVLAGGRLDRSSDSHGTRTGLFTTLAAGYDFVAAPSSSTIRSGPIVDVSLGWGAQASDGAGYVRVHGRFGVTPNNQDLRAVFLSAGLELRLDRRSWNDRN